MADHLTEQHANLQETEQSLESVPTYDQISALAYALWLERGCPIGSSDEDWYKAERALKDTAQV